MMSHGVSLTKGNPHVSRKFRLARYKNSPMDPPALIDSLLSEDFGGIQKSKVGLVNSRLPAETS